MKRHTNKAVSKLSVWLISSTLIMGSFIGCGAEVGYAEITNQSMDESIIVPDYSVEYDYIEEGSIGSLETEHIMESASKEEGIGKDAVTIDTSTELNRKIIQTGSLNIETNTFNETIQNMIEAVKEVEGFVQDTFIEGNQNEDYKGNRWASLTVRVPKEVFDSFMNTADRYGNVRARSVSSEDITHQYVDTELRFSILEEQQKRLQQLLEEATTIEELFEIEQALSEVIYEMERLKGTLNQYDSLIDYTTIHIDIYESYDYEEQEDLPVTFMEKVNYQIEKGFEITLDVVEGVVLGLIRLTPFVVIVGTPIGLIIFGTVWWIKKARKKKSQKDEI